MKANELRIANYVGYFKKTYQITGLSCDIFSSYGKEIPYKEMVTIGYFNSVPVDHIYPIKVGLISLRKLGFVRTGDNSAFYKGDNFNISVLFNNKGCELMVYTELNSDYVCIEKSLPKVKYIHELQNSIFILYGVEL